MHRRLRRAFYLQPTLDVARQLIGMYLVRRKGRTCLSGRIVEVEGYLGEDDPASHAYRGRTPRNATMYRKGGHLYVYFTYGMHFCCNVVTGREGTGHAVLLRALEPVQGIRLMARRRGVSPERRLQLCSGPAKTCQAFGIVREDDGTDLCGNDTWIEKRDGPVRPDEIGVSRRIGISRGREFPWRFFLHGNSYVSR